MPDAHPGYITWEQFEGNLALLRDNAQAHGAERRKSPPREGPALLQGLAVCGVCGRRMTVRYHTRKGGQWPDYVCQREAIDTATSKCQTIPGSGVDETIGELLVETVSPVTLEVALQVQVELEERAEGSSPTRTKLLVAGTRLFFVAAVLIGGILGLSLANAVFVDEMMMDNTEALERKVDALTEELRRLRDDLKTR